MFLLLLCLTLFQIYCSLWRKLFKVFWWPVMAYNMPGLTATYNFQVQHIPTYLYNLMRYTDESWGAWAWSSSELLFLLYQYLLSLGISPALCMDCPWHQNQTIPRNSTFIKWLYLPDFFRAPNSTNLISDFLHSSEPFRCSLPHILKGGTVWLSSTPIAWSASGGIRQRSHPYQHLQLGFLLACFYLLLFGTTLLQKHTCTHLTQWGCCSLYNIAIIIFKNMFLLLSYIFIE
ncbi:hypothetical protein HJG60_010508 [Phyllostomus discolor]|uniref:Uncharacterized protein n=1 Tax=Phyllostomus discolor TaxID=89673 RepID=A0A834AN97_9CHIR|nr:hypothetical protein HJG60_010508 [Phyllostomus discolor]